MQTNNNSNNIESLSKEEVVKLLDLQPHPEGGFFKETFRSSVGAVADKATGSSSDGSSNGPSGRVCKTAILFLLGTDDKSHLHVLTAGNDEMWHHYAGKALEIVEINPETSQLTKTKLGKNLLGGETIQYVVEAGQIFGSRVVKDGTTTTVAAASSASSSSSSSPDWTLVGCTVCPGFEFEDFDMPSRAQLLERFPQHEVDIVALTRGS